MSAFWDLGIPQRDCGKRSFCGRCANCRRILDPRTVPCAQCGRGVDERRADIIGLRGLCVECFAPDLPSERAKRAPVYETAAWARGERLD